MTWEEPEIWKPIPGYEGHYEVSNMGRVASLKCGKRKIRKLSKNAGGYMIVALYKGGIQKTVRVNRVVLEAFVGPCPENMESCHGSPDRTDNRLKNLRWATRSDNNFDQVRQGTHPEASKVKCKHGHLLVNENLKPKRFAVGERHCLACARTHSKVYNSKVRYATDISQHFKAISDLHYEMIQKFGPKGYRLTGEQIKKVCEK